MTRLAATALSLAALSAGALAVAFSAASFTDTEQNPQTVSAVADFLGPTASASTLVKTQGGVDGYVSSKGTYYVYANGSDSGNPASGIASVKANVSSLTSGQTAVSLLAGSKSYSLSLADSAGNSESQSFSVTVDNGPFKGSDFETGNGSSTDGKPETGDTVSFEFNKAPDPNSIVSGWNGSGAKPVTVSIADGSANDSLAVGGVALKGDFTSSTASFSGSTMSLSGSTVTIVLGTASGSTKTDTDKSKAVWTPSASNYDLAGNSSSTSNVTGANKVQF